MANKNQTVEVVREVKVTVGGITIARDGANIVFSQGETVLNIPNGAVATAVLAEAAGFVSNEVPAKGKNAAKKNATGTPRKRRTKAEMEAARAAEAAASGASGASGEAEGAEPELETV